MSYVIAAPEYLAAAATDLSNIGSALSDANSAALGPVSSVLPAGADEVSASIAALFGAHAQTYEAISATAQMFHTQFVQLMSGGAEQYLLAEAANATPLQTIGSGLLSESTTTGQVFTAVQPAASAVSMAGSAPLATAGLASGAAPVAPPPPPVASVVPASAVPAALVPAGALAPAAQAAPIGSSALVPAAAPAAALPVESGVVSATPASATASVAAIEAEAPALSPLTAMPPVPLSGTSLAAAPMVAPPATAGPAGSSNEHPGTTPALAASAE